MCEPSLFIMTCSLLTCCLVVCADGFQVGFKNRARHRQQRRAAVRSRQFMPCCVVSTAIDSVCVSAGSGRVCASCACGHVGDVRGRLKRTGADCGVNVRMPYAQGIIVCVLSLMSCRYRQSVRLVSVCVRRTVFQMRVNAVWQIRNPCLPLIILMRSI